MRNRLPISREAAERLFNRKAHPDTNLSPKEFLKKRVVEPVVKGAKATGRAVKKGAKATFNFIGDAIEKDLKYEDAKSDKFRKELEEEWYK